MRFPRKEKIFKITVSDEEKKEVKIQVTETFLKCVNKGKLKLILGDQLLIAITKLLKEDNNE